MVVPFILMDFPKHIKTLSFDCSFCVLRGHRKNSLNHNICMSLKIVFILDPDDLPPYAANHLGLHCLPKYLFTGLQNEKG